MWGHSFGFTLTPMSVESGCGSRNDQWRKVNVVEAFKDFVRLFKCPFQVLIVRVAVARRVSVLCQLTVG
jgi:hypothetical protein